ncbi:hypothetical protein O2K51_08905 [Apibacter raozihei]|uniref:HYC_CC_PP family protein n=1 Tax=Apibacter raozihei TaxID=2500547 RepID=UPI000FE2A1DD|nr:hypothetical protein [Apibacter raozihei]
MKFVQSLFLVCLILFANMNFFVYQNWCHGENIGYTINSKKFNKALRASTHKENTSFKKDNCCKDVLIKSHSQSLFSTDSGFILSVLNINGIIQEWNWDFTYVSRLEQKIIPGLCPNPPPKNKQLFKLYCRYTFYG